MEVSIVDHFREVFTLNINCCTATGLARIRPVGNQFWLSEIAVSKTSTSPVLSVETNLEVKIYYSILIGRRLTNNSNSGIKVSPHNLITKLTVRYHSVFRPVAEIKSNNLDCSSSTC